MTVVLLAAAPLLPILLAAGLFARAGGRWRRLAPWALAPAIGLAVAGTGEPVALPWLLTGAVLGLDATSQVFLLSTALLWFLAAWYAQGSLAREAARGRFFAFFLLTAGGNVGVTLALDVVSFYCFFAIMTFSAYGLILHRRSAAARRAGAVYLALAVLGEGALLVAFLLIADAGGGLLAEAPAAVAASPWRDAIIALLLAGFGAKVGVLGLHVSLPLAYDATPVPGAAVFAGPMINAAVLGWLRVLPLGEPPSSGWAPAFIGIGFAAALYGILIGLTQPRPKVILAYSSISQMGLVTAGVGFGLAAIGSAPAARAALTLYALHHALAKGALFLGVGVVGAARGRARRAIFAGLVLLALVLSGAPLTSGALAKHWLKDLAMRTPWGDTAAHCLSIATIATTVLMVHFLRRAAEARVAPYPGRPAVAWWTAVGAALVAAWLVPPAAADPAATATAAAVAGAAWPVLVGALTAFVVGPLATRAARRVPRVPPGDIVVPLERWLGRASGAACTLAAVLTRARGRLARSGSPEPKGGATARLIEAAVQLEIGLRAWTVVGLALLLLFGLLLGLLALA